MSANDIELIAANESNVLVVENRMGNYPLYLKIAEDDNVYFFKHSEEENVPGKYTRVVEVAHLFESYTTPILLYSQNGAIGIKKLGSTCKVKMLNGGCPKKFISVLCDLDIFKEENEIIIEQLGKIATE